MYTCTIRSNYLLASQNLRPSDESLSELISPMARAGGGDGELLSMKSSNVGELVPRLVALEVERLDGGAGIDKEGCGTEVSPRDADIVQRDVDTMTTMTMTTDTRFRFGLGYKHSGVY